MCWCEPSIVVQQCIVGSSCTSKMACAHGNWRFLAYLQELYLALSYCGGTFPVVLLLPTWVILINKMCELVKPGSTLSACEVVLN